MSEEPEIFYSVSFSMPRNAKLTTFCFTSAHFQFYETVHWLLSFQRFLTNVPVFALKENATKSTVRLKK